MITRELYQQLIAFVREETGAGSMPLALNSRIEEDLGVTGGDAVDLIKKYATFFNVDVSGFTYSRYFYPEPPIIRSLGQIVPFTIGHLADGIDVGMLNDDLVDGA